MFATPSGNDCVISPFYFVLSLHSVSNAFFLPHPCSGDTFRFPIGPMQGLEQKWPGFGEGAINRGRRERKKRSIIHRPVFLPYLFGIKLFHKFCSA